MCNFVDYVSKNATIIVIDIKTYKYVTVNIHTALFQVQMEATLAKMVCKLIGVWIFAWTPYAIMALWAMFFDAHNLSPLMGVIPLLFCKVSAGANVIVYGVR